MWALTMRNLSSEDLANAVFTIEHHIVIIATGPFSQPRMPVKVNMEKFQGTQFHNQA
jgi:cation diffusion facilitator CzcD-associated flavoprotein CzcO